MKLLKLVCTFLLLISLLPIQSFAIAEKDRNADILYYEDGSYMIVSLSIIETRSNTTTANKRYTYHIASGEEAWSATLSATFEFDGTEYWTTACNISIEIYSSTWHEISKSATMRGSSAYGEFTVCNKILGITTKTVSDTLILSCSPHGTIT